MKMTILTAIVITFLSNSALAALPGGENSQSRKLTAEELIEKAMELKNSGVSPAETTEILYNLIQKNRITEAQLRQVAVEKLGIPNEVLQQSSEHAVLALSGKVDLSKYSASYSQTATPLMIIPVFCVFHPAGLLVCTAGVVAIIWGILSYL